MDRRGFLKCLGGAGALSLLQGLGPLADVVSASQMSEPLRLTNLNTKESYDVDLFVNGQWNPNAVLICDFLMRDWRQAQTVQCDRRIYAGLYVMQQYFGKGRRIRIHSGYRTQATNRILKEQGYNPAIDSQHLHARAVDFSIEGASNRDIATVAYASNQCGVGLYPGFVHWDFRGRKARWGESFG